MKDLLWLIRKTLISTFRDYKNLLLYFGLPLAGIMLAMAINSGSGAVDLNIGVVNQDNGQSIAQDMMDYLGGMEAVHISEVEQAEANDLIIKGELDAAVIIPAGFSVSVKKGETESAQIVSIKGAEVTAYVRSYLNQYVGNIASIAKLADGDAEKFDRMYANYQNSDFGFKTELVEDQSVQHGSSKQTIAYLIVFMMFAAVNLSGMLIQERENRTFLRILSSPASAVTYVLSNIMVNLAIMMLQIAVTLVVMIQVFQINPGVPIVSLFLLLGLFALVAISLSLVIVAFSPSSMAAKSFLSGIIIPTSLLAGCMFPIELMPETMQKIADFLPQHWLLDTLGKLQLGHSLGSLYVNLIILAAFAATLALVAVYKFGRNNDTRSYI